MTIRFYSWPQSSGSGVHWALEELGLDYEYVRLNRTKGEHRSAEYLAINPNGKVPALVDGEECYFESLSILLHLAERYGAMKGLWPAAGKQRAEALGWTTWSTTELMPFMLQYIYHGLDAPMSFDPPDRSKAAAEYSLAIPHCISTCSRSASVIASSSWALFRSPTFRSQQRSASASLRACH